MEKLKIAATLEKAKAAANALSDAMDADVLFFSGEIYFDSAKDLIAKCNKRNRKKNVVLIPVTAGGDGDASYRIARHLQNKYEKYFALVTGWCKSGGTLVVSGANHLPVYAQVDPSEIGECSRAMAIAKNYAMRLDQHSGNFNSEDSLTYLVESYPDHGFVIDRKEARSIFSRVDEPTPAMSALEAALEDCAVFPVDGDDNEDGFEVQYLSSEPPPHLAVVETGAAT